MGLRQTQLLASLLRSLSVVHWSYLWFLDPFILSLSFHHVSLSFSLPPIKHVSCSHLPQQNNAVALTTAPSQPLLANLMGECVFVCVLISHYQEPSRQGAMETNVYTHFCWLCWQDLFWIYRISRGNVYGTAEITFIYEISPSVQAKTVFLWKQKL